MRKQNKGFTTILVVIGVILLIGVVYFLGTKNNKTNENKSESVVTPTSTPLSKDSDQKNGEEKDINELINNFYQTLKSQKGKELFSYMTPPNTQEEKDSYNFLTGADLDQSENDYYRLFGRIKISKPKITEIKKISETLFSVKVTDQISIYSNVDPIGWSNLKPRNVILTIIKDGDKWLIDKFTETTPKYGSEKYGGFGQGY